MHKDRERERGRDKKTTCSEILQALASSLFNKDLPEQVSHSKNPIFPPPFSTSHSYLISFIAMISQPKQLHLLVFLDDLQLSQRVCWFVDLLLRWTSSRIWPKTGECLAASATGRATALSSGRCSMVHGMWSMPVLAGPVRIYGKIEKNGGSLYVENFVIY